MAKLSTGVIADIINGAHPEKPLLQILTMKRIPSESQERWRLLVSDGQWSSSFAMLATQLNGKVSSNEITNNCVVCLDRYICNMIQENKKILIILDLTVVQSGEDVGSKIGEPVVYDTTKSREQQQQSLPAKPQPQQNHTYSNNKPQGNTFNSTPKFGASNNFSTNGSTPNKTPSGGNVHPIASLTPYQNRWTICARVTNKSAIRTWSNSRGEGKLFSMDLLDESGEIRATAFNEQCDKYFEMIELNKVYFITNASLKSANKQFCNLDNDYEMSFNQGTEVTPCHDSTAIPVMQFNFVTLEQLENLKKDSIVDVIGVCKETMEMSSVVQRSTGRELRKRDIQLLDHTKREVRLTLWGTQAESFDGSQQPVVAVKGAKVSDFNGCSLSTLSSSALQINPDIQEAHKLKGWYENGGNVTETVNLSNQRPGMGGPGDAFKLFSEAKAEKLGTTKSEYFWSTALMGNVRKENCLYAACPKPDCNKKVMDMNNGLYRCEKCNREYDSFKWRLMLQVALNDYLSSTWATIFHDAAESIIGKNASELAALRDEDQTKFETVLNSILLKYYHLKLRCSMETYNDKQSWKNTVLSITPLNYQEHSRRLLTEIKQMSGQS